MTNIWEKTLYKSNIQCLIDTPIFEYDISKTNINVLRDKNIISENQYNYLYNIPKIERNIIVGVMRGKDPSITQILNQSIMEARRFFIIENNISDSEVLSIRNDSITIIGREARNLNVTERVKFRLTGHYNSFYSLPNMRIKSSSSLIELFYLYDPVKNIEVLDTKGLGESDKYHREYLLDFLSELFYTIQVVSMSDAMNLLSIVYKKYINLDMDLGFYREFNTQSLFKLNSKYSLINSLYTEVVTDADKYNGNIDISYNENVLRYLNKLIASIYLNNKTPIA